MITKINYNEYAPQAIEQLHKGGAFLTVRQGDKTNTMTIGWGAIGRIWSRPVFTVLVRHNRYTYHLLKDSADFSISIPLDNSLDSQLEFCGSKSGRDTDKHRECNLTLNPGQLIATPIISACPLHYECKIIHAQPMELTALAAELRERYYQEEPIHTFFHGEIVISYLTGGGNSLD